MECGPVLSPTMMPSQTRSPDLAQREARHHHSGNKKKLLLFYNIEKLIENTRRFINLHRTVFTYNIYPYYLINY